MSYHSDGVGWLQEFGAAPAHFGNINSDYHNFDDAKQEN